MHHQTITVPEPLVYAFTPAYTSIHDEQPIRIVFDGIPGYAETTISAPNLEDAENLCDVLNAPLDLDRAKWTSLVARSMRPPAPHQK